MIVDGTVVTAEQIAFQLAASRGYSSDAPVSMTAGGSSA